MSTPVYEEEQPIIEENEVEEEQPIIEESEVEEEQPIIEENEVEEKANVEEEVKEEKTEDNTNFVRDLFLNISDSSKLLDKSPIDILLSPTGKAYNTILYILSGLELDKDLDEFVTAWITLFQPYIEIYLNTTIEEIKEDLDKSYEEDPEEYEDEIPVYKSIISSLRKPVDAIEKNTDIQDLDIVKQFTKSLHDKLDTLDDAFAGFEKSKTGGKPKRKTRKSRKSKRKSRKSKK
jgi:hypothetical protein